VLSFQSLTLRASLRSFVRGGCNPCDGQKKAENGIQLTRRFSGFSLSEKFCPLLVPLISSLSLHRLVFLSLFSFLLLQLNQIGLRDEEGGVLSLKFLSRELVRGRKEAKLNLDCFLCDFNSCRPLRVPLFDSHDLVQESFVVPDRGQTKQGGYTTFVPQAG
jgi:hypothetical protein